MKCFGFVLIWSETTQNSMQRVGNMPPLPPYAAFPPFDSETKSIIQAQDFFLPWMCLLLPITVKIICVICLISLSENFNRIRKINKLWPKSYQFWRWSKYTSTFQAIPSMCCPENVRKPHIWPVKIAHKWTKSTLLKGVRINQDAKFLPFLLCFLYKMPANRKVKIAPKLGKSTGCAQNLINTEGCQHTAACQIWGHSFNVFSTKCQETLIDRRTFWWSPGLDGWKDAKTDRWMKDGNPENIMLKVPKGRGVEI